MSDRLPGSSPDNPIWFGLWHIFCGPDSEDGYPYEFVHSQAKGPDDERYGRATSIDDAKTQIEKMERTRTNG